VTSENFSRDISDVSHFSYGSYHWSPKESNTSQKWKLMLLQTNESQKSK